MTVDRDRLESLSREGLLAEARKLGVRRPEVMTRVELADEIVRLETPNPVEQKRARGWFGVARDLLASVVEQGLNLPDAAAMIRGDVRFEPLRTPQAPVATVTLAEIYGAQGHVDRAVTMLDEVLAREPEHDVARKLRDRLVRERDARRAPPAAVDPEEEAPPSSPEKPAHVAEPSAVSRFSPVASGTAAPVDATPPTVRASDHPATVEQPVARIPAPAAVPAVAVVAPAPAKAAAPAPAKAAAPPPEKAAAPPPEKAAAPPPAKAAAPAPAKAAAPAPESAPEPGADTAPALARSAALVVARTSDSALALYFERGPSRPGEAPAIIRVVEHRARPGGAERVERDLTVHGERGSASITDLEPGSVVRAALGTARDGRFRALAVGAEVRASERGFVLAWAPRRGVDYLAVAHRSAGALSSV